MSAEHGSVVAELLRQVLGPRRRVGWPLGIAAMPVQPGPTPKALHLALRADADHGSTEHTSDGALIAGQPLFSAAGHDPQPSPVSGTVQRIGFTTSLRGGRPRRTLFVAPSDQAPAPLSSLDPEQATVDELVLRLRETGVVCGDETPASLASTLAAGPNTLVVLVADREPALGACGQLFRQRGEDAVAATRLLKRISGAQRTCLAVLEADAARATELCGGAAVEVLAIPARYPEALDPLIAQRVGDPATCVISLSAALAALDAVARGQVQASRVLTVVGPDGQPVGNYEVALGTPLADVLAHAGLSVHDGDKVLVGGPMRGSAQSNLDSGVDATLDALVLVAHDQIAPVSDEPCVNCGTCIDICPVQLQVHMIGRYAKFGMFERSGELEVEQCIRCGLCASVCVARVPLMQLIDLSLRELAKEADRV